MLVGIYVYADGCDTGGSALEHEIHEWMHVYMRILFVQAQCAQHCDMPGRLDAPSLFACTLFSPCPWPRPLNGASAWVRLGKWVHRTNDGGFSTMKMAALDSWWVVYYGLCLGHAGGITAGRSARSALCTHSPTSQTASSLILSHSHALPRALYMSRCRAHHCMHGCDQKSLYFESTRACMRVATAFCLICICFLKLLMWVLVCECGIRLPLTHSPCRPSRQRSSCQRC
jgi:hypothetical protein